MLLSCYFIVIVMLFRYAILFYVMLFCRGNFLHKCYFFLFLLRLPPALKFLVDRSLLFRSFSTKHFFMGLGYPHAQPPTWRTEEYVVCSCLSQNRIQNAYQIRTAKDTKHERPVVSLLCRRSHRTATRDY